MNNMKINISRFILQWFVNRNMKRPIIPFTQNLYFWRPNIGYNVGDELSSVVFNGVLIIYI